jgi:dolichol-phosphate mannosyltransferase
VINGIKLNPLGYKILMEILVKGMYCNVTEIPYIFKNRKKGKSKLNLKEIFDYVIFLMKMRMRK